MSSQPVQHTDEVIHTKRRQAVEVLRRLDRDWSPGPWEPNHKPVDTLVATILSQNTSDVNTERAFDRLCETFSEWAEVANATGEDVVEAIRPGGLAAQKGPRIQRVLADILPTGHEDPNEALQSRLENMTTHDAMSWLTGFPGVGPKTAACVLLFAVGKPVVPVDTHVYRVAGRIGLIGDNVDANRAHDELLNLIPPEESYRFHVHLIHHGRTVCKARNPDCHQCSLNELCDYAKGTRTGRTAD